ncbi:MAG TPA: hypothetical protein VKM55_07545 [Candidatus Lokiarchaeia archaeon]|nr:hypothetical protein [Candidatus Lokiarchaeia archaeon]
MASNEHFVEIIHGKLEKEHGAGIGNRSVVGKRYIALARPP